MRTFVFSKVEGMKEWLSYRLKLPGRHRIRFKRVISELTLPNVTYLNGCVMTRPFSKTGSQFIVLALVGPTLNIWGLSQLIFRTGHFPTGLAMAFVKRNVLLSECHWGHWRDDAHEMLGVTAILPMDDIDSEKLRRSFATVCDELDYFNHCWGLAQSGLPKQERANHDHVQSQHHFDSLRETGAGRHSAAQTIRRID
jgi:hypothetical protein